MTALISWRWTARATCSSRGGGGIFPNYDYATIKYAGPPPLLAIASSGANVILIWPSASAADFALQGNADVNLTNSWAAVGQTVVSNLGAYSVTLPLTSTNQFFRLRKP